MKARRGAGGEDRTGDVVASWNRARAVRRVGPPLSVGELALDGRDLIALGLKPGPAFGRILDALLDWVLEDPDRNEADRLRARVAELAEDAADG